MSLFSATLIFGIGLLLLGMVLLSNRPATVASIKALPRSSTAAMFLFGGAAAWFLCLVWNLPNADFGEYHVLLTVAFAAVAALSFKCVPDFLAVRGLSVLVLLAAWHFREAGYMHYDKSLRLLMIAPLLLLFVPLAIWLGVQPYRLRDFFEWLFLRPGRARGVGAALLGYGLVLAVVAFTY